MTLSPQQIDQIADIATQHINNGEQASALKILQRYGFAAEAQAAYGTKHYTLLSSDFCCPAHKSQVRAGCRLRTCKFWLSDPQSNQLTLKLANNCLLSYCEHQQTEQLSTDEIAYLYGRDATEVEATLESALRRLRGNAMQSDSAEDSTLERTFWFIETDKVCCVCGGVVGDDVLPVPDTPLAYCDRECRDEMSSDLIRCEYRFGRPIADVVRWAIRRFRNLSLLDKTLGLKRRTLLRVCRTHLGRELQSFFPKVKTKNDNPPWVRKRKVAPHDALQRRTERLVRKAGQPTLDPTRPQQQLQAACV